MKIKNFCSLKNTVKRIEDQAIGWDEILTKHIPQIHKALLKVHNIKTNYPI